MSSSITLSAATRQNLLSLQDTASLLSTTQSRLSTGKKVNSALDNPTNFFTAQSLTSRSTDLSALLDGLSNGVQVIQSANQGITSIQKLLDNAKSTASQALADKSGGSGGIQGGVGAQAAKASSTAALTSLGTTVNGATTFDLSGPGKDASLNVSLDGGKTNTLIRLDSSAFSSSGLDLTKVTSDQLLANINAQIKASSQLSGKVTAAVGSDGRLNFTTTSVGSSAKIAVAGAGSSTIDIGFGKASGTPTAAKVTAANALGATTDFSDGASASLTLSDGIKTATVTLTKDSVIDDAGNTLGTSASQQNVLKAIQRQVTAAGIGATVSVDSSNKLTFTSTLSGPNAALTVTGGVDTTAGRSASSTGLGFTTFTPRGVTTTAGAAVPAINSSAGTLGGTPLTTTGTSGVTTFGKALPTGNTTTALPTGLSSTFTVNGKAITIDSTSTTSANGNPALGNAAKTSDILSAINKQLAAAGSTVTASQDATTGAIAFTDANKSNAAPTVAITSDYLGLLSTATDATFGNASPGSFDISGSKTGKFDVTVGGNTQTITINANSPKSGQATLGSSNSVTNADVADSINTQLKAGNIAARAYFDANNKLNIVASGNSTVAIANISDSGTQTSGVFSSSTAAAVTGTAATQTTTQNVAASTTEANAVSTLSAASFGSGNSAHTTFTVNGNSITIDGSSAYDSNPAHTLGSQSPPTNASLVAAINLKLAAIPNLSVTASLDTNNRLAFSDTSSAGTPPTVATSGSTNTDQLGLFGTPSKTTLTTALPISGSLDLSGGKAATFNVGSTTVTLNAAATNGSGGTLGNNATAGQLLKSINSQLGSSGYSAYLDANNKLAFVGPNTVSAPPVISTSSTATTNDTIGIGIGTGATAKAAAPAATTSGAFDLSGGKSSVFTIGDGTNTATVTINQESLLADGVTALGTAPTLANVTAAIQRQLDTNKTAGGAAAAVAATVAFDGSGNLTATSKAVGTGAQISLAGITDTAGIGLDVATPVNGTYTAGTGTAATGVTSSGTDPTDGSSVASLSGGLSLPASGAAVAANGNASFTLALGNNKAALISINGGANGLTSSALVDAINAAIGNDTGLSGNVQASLVNGKVQLATTASGSSQKLAVVGTGSTDIGFGTSSASKLTASGTDLGGSTGTSSVRAALAKQFNNILTQITQQAQDSSYNGINLLYRTSTNAQDNTLHLAFNEKNTSSLDVAGVKFDAQGLGLNAVTGDFQSDADINAAVENLNKASSTLRTQSSTFGSNLSVVQNRQDFTKSLTTILDTGAANLTNADLNEEAANSQALSTRNSLAVSALSLANQAQQGILQLLR